MVNEFSNSHANVITMIGEILETVDKFTYMGATLTKDVKSEKEIQIRFDPGKHEKYNMEEQ